MNQPTNQPINKPIQRSHQGDVPSADDSALVFHLPSDPFETTNLNSTDHGREQRAALLKLAMDKEVTCACFQC